MHDRPTSYRLRTIKIGPPTEKCAGGPFCIFERTGEPTRARPGRTLRISRLPIAKQRRCKRDSTQHLARFGSSQSNERSDRVWIVIVLAGWQSRRFQHVPYANQLVGIGTLIPAGAYRGSDCINRDRPIEVDLARDVPATTGRRIERRWQVGDAVGYSDVQPVLQHVLQLPRAIDEGPLLHPRGSLTRCVSNVPVDCGRDECSVAFVANVKRARVREPNSEWKRRGCHSTVRCRATCQRCRESRQNRDRRGRQCRSVAAWQNTLRSHLIHRVDPISTAPFGYVKSVVKNRESAEIVVLPRFVCLYIKLPRRRVNHLRDRKIANLVD